MKLAANLHHLYQELPGLDRIDAAARDGFDGVEWPFPYPHAPAALAARLRGAGLPLVLINTPPGPHGEPGLAALPGREAAFRDGLERALALAAATGCTRLHVMAGCPPAGATRGPLLDNLHWAVPLARQAGVQLLLEPLNRHDMPGYAYHRPAEVLPLLQVPALAGLRLQLDLYHLAHEGLDAARTLREHAALTGHVQLAQAPHRGPPDLGCPATLQALQVLAGIGHLQWLGLEYQPGGATADSLGWRAALQALLAGREVAA